MFVLLCKRDFFSRPKSNCQSGQLDSVNEVKVIVEPEMDTMGWKETNRLT